MYPCFTTNLSQQDEGQDEGEVITDEIVAVKREIGDIADEIEDEIEDEVGKEVDDDEGEKDDVEKQGGANRQKCGGPVDDPKNSFDVPS